jgi:heterodisulfide reductase subunit C
MKAQVQNLNCIEESESIWLCMMCYCCAERCPRGVKPFEIAQQARAFVSRTSHSSKNTEYDLQNLQTSPSNPIPQQLLVAAARKRG